MAGEESDEDDKDLGAMDVDLKDEGNGTDGLRPMHQAGIFSYDFLCFINSKCV